MRRYHRLSSLQGATGCLREVAVPTSGARPLRSDMARPGRKPRGLPLFALLLLLLPLCAQADCTFDKSGGGNNGNGNGNGNGNTQYYTPAPVYYTLPSTISIPFDLPPQGSALGSPVTASPTNPAQVTCTFGTSYGIVNLVGDTVPILGSRYIYKATTVPTSVPGVGYQLIHTNDTTTYMGPYGSYTTTGGSSTYSVPTTLQLVQIGTIASGSVLPAGTLANWQWGSIAPEYFVLNNSVTFVASACRTQDVTVTLPAVSTRAFSGLNSTAGTTSFPLQLECPSGSTGNLSIQLDASSGTPVGYSNVLKNTGTATGVGVDLLDQAGIATNTTVAFGTKTKIGPATSGTSSLTYFARYHAISANVTAGTVVATATFTLTYD